MVNIKVNTSTAYDVIIDKNIISFCGKYIRDAAKEASRVALISDDKVFPIYGDAVKKSIEDSGLEAVCFTFENGEKSKNIKTYAEILEFMAENRLTRQDAAIALGGGVCGDMAGFAAATYLRGIKYIQIPTTLLASVDSSVGGKTAIDLECGKNLAGAFHQPSAVICDTNTFNTLSPDQIACGFAEVIKYGILYDRDFFGGLLQRKYSYEEIVAKCVNFKREVVEADETEHGGRKFLNLGHTLGHAVEKLSGYTLTHGAAVAVGTMMIAKISEHFGFAEKSMVNLISDIFKVYNLPTDFHASADEIINIAMNDKKAESKDITLVMPRKIGKCTLEKTDYETFKKMVRYCTDNR